MTKQNTLSPSAVHCCEADIFKVKPTFLLIRAGPCISVDTVRELKLGTLDSSTPLCHRIFGQAHQTAEAL